MKAKHLKFAIIAGLVQVGFIIAFAMLLEYDSQANAFFYGSPEALEQYKVIGVASKSLSTVLILFSRGRKTSD